MTTSLHDKRIYSCCIVRLPKILVGALALDPKKQALRRLQKSDSELSFIRNRNYFTDLNTGSKYQRYPQHFPLGIDPLSMPNVQGYANYHFIRQTIHLRRQKCN